MTVQKSATETLIVNVYIYDPPARAGWIVCSRTNGGSWSVPTLTLDSAVPIDDRAWRLLRPAVDEAFAEIRLAMKNEKVSP